LLHAIKIHKEAQYPKDAAILCVFFGTHPHNAEFKGISNPEMGNRCAAGN
jgi:hypothetical protein